MGNENLTSRYPVRDIALQALFVCYRRINKHLCMYFGMPDTGLEGIYKLFKNIKYGIVAVTN